MKSLLRFTIFSFLLPVTAFMSRAQELNCRVEINASQVNTTNKQVFETLQQALADYVNTNHWTQAQFSPIEKIDCTLFFTIKEYDDGEGRMKGDIQVQATRPVYNSSYTTTVLNFKDTRVDFTYRENDPLIYNEAVMENNLTQIVNFYVYLILAMDFDTYSPRGGQAYYDKLATIVQQAQSSGETGWKAFEDTKNRPSVLAALTDPSTAQMRDLLYQYHRNGLDQMSVSPDKGRANITQALNTLDAVYKVAPMSVGLSMFKDAKLDELVNIYSKGLQDERESVAKMLQPLYPTEQQRLEKIRKGDQENR